MRILGSLELFVDDRAVPISRVQVRRLLTVLAARTHLATSSDVLVDALWPDQLPADPRAALSVVVSRLRSALGEARDSIEVSPDGFRLTAEVDLIEFERLLAAARHQDDAACAAVLLEEALALWRGRPFVDFDELGVLRPISTRLDEARWNAVTLLAEARAAVGDHAGVIALALPMHEEDPRRELLAAAVARSLATEGRKSDALGVLARTRSVLRDELGLDPSALIADLESAILTGSVDLRPSSRGSTGSGSSCFVGRTKELEALADLTAGLNLVVGDPGIGKSALVREASFRAVEAGVVVVSAAAPLMPERPMESVAELVEQLIERAPPRPEEQLLTAALSRIVPAVVPTAPALHALTRDVLVDSIAEYIARSAPVGELLIVVDDCQWLDPLSALVLERIVCSGRCSVLAATRSDIPAHLDWVCDGSVGVRLIELQPFDERDIDALIAGEAGTAGHRIDAPSLLARSGGNALFAAMLIELITEGASANDGLPSTVLVAVRSRLEALSSRARDTLQIAATIGSAFSLGLLRQLVPAADADLHEAVAARLVTIDERRDEGSFVHVILAEGAYELLPDGRRVLLHDQIGELLAGSGAFAAEYARHFTEASALDPHRAASAHNEAGLSAAFAYSWEEVEAHALQGLDHLGPSGGGRLKAQLAVLLGRAQRFLHRGHPDDALVEGASIARELGDDALFADAVIALTVQSWSMSGAINPVAVDLFDEALTLDLSPEKRAQLCAAGSTFAMTDRHGRAREIYHEALDLALTLDDPTVQAEVLRYSRWGLIHPDDLATLSEVTVLLADLAGHDTEFRWGAATNRFAIGTIMGDRAMVDRAILGLRAMHRSMGPSPRDWEMAHIETGYAVFTHDLDGVDALLDRVMEIGLAMTSREWLLPIYGAAVVGVRRAQGRLGEILPLAEQALVDRSDFLGWHAVAAAAAAAAGDVARARTALEVTAVDGFATLIPDATWSAVTTLITDAVVVLDDHDHARSLLTILAPYAGRMTWSGVTTLGPIDHALGRLAAVIGDEDVAARHRRAAAAMEARVRRQAVS